METPFKVESAADALDQIRVGGGHMLLTVNQRLNEVEAALRAGQFTVALEAVSDLHGKVSQLAHAQTAMGLLAANHLVKVGEIQEGMVVPGVGPITDIGPCRCEREGCNNVAVTVGGQTIVLDRDAEMIVEAE